MTLFSLNQRFLRAMAGGSFRWFSPLREREAVEVLETLGARAIAGRGGKRRWILVEGDDPFSGLAFEPHASRAGTTIDVVPIEHGFARDSSLVVRSFLAFVALVLMVYALVFASAGALPRIATGIVLGWVAVMALFDAARWLLMHPLLADGALQLTRRRVRKALFAHESDFGGVTSTRRSLSH